LGVPPQHYFPFLSVLLCKSLPIIIIYEIFIDYPKPVRLKKRESVVAKAETPSLSLAS
jgi:hypothetical protein